MGYGRPYLRQEGDTLKGTLLMGTDDAFDLGSGTSMVRNAYIGRLFVKDPVGLDLANANPYLYVNSGPAWRFTGGAIVHQGTWDLDLADNLLKNPKNSAASGLSGAQLDIEIDIGGTPYYFTVYPTKA